MSAFSKYITPTIFVTTKRLVILLVDSTVVSCVIDSRFALAGLSCFQHDKVNMFPVSFSKHFVLAMHLASAKFFAATFWVVPEKTKEADPPAVTVV